MLKELKELPEAAFELREISPVEKYLGMEIVRDRPAQKLWLHQQVYVNKLRQRFIDEEQTGRVLKTPVSVNAYAELMFDNEEFQSCEECRATTTDVRLIVVCTTSLKLVTSLWSLEADQSRCVWSAMQMPTTLVTSRIGRALAATFSSLEEPQSPGRASASSVRRSRRPSQYTSRPTKSARRLAVYVSSLQSSDCSTQGSRFVLHVDNASAITVALGLGLKGNLEHMERYYAWLQQMVKRGKIALQYIPTSEQPADFLTKALHFPAFNRCSVVIGQVRPADVGDGDDEVQH
ncbi:unnamed protein product [Closterium sp. NIES-54]